MQRARIEQTELNELGEHGKIKHKIRKKLIEQEGCGYGWNIKERARRARREHGIC